MKLFALVLALAISHTVLAQSGAFTPVDPSEVSNNQQIQDLRDFGANYVIEQGIKNGELPNGKYVVSDTLGVESQVVNGLNYKFDVELNNEEGLVVRTEYVVYYQAWTNTTQVTSYSFIAITSNGETIAEEETVFPNEEEFEFIFEEESVFWNAEDFVQGDDAVVAGGYTQVDLSDVNDDEGLQDLLNFGAQYVVAEGIQRGRLPNHNFVVSQVQSVFRQVVNGVNYKFNVDLTDGQGFTIRADYVVYSQLWSGLREVTSYSFDVLSAANGPIAVDEPSDETDGEPEASLPGGWSPVDPNEVNTDQNLRDILDFGVNYVVAQGAQSGQLASSNYYVEEVNNVEKQVVNGENYKFDVDLENPQGGDATVTFVVYQPINGERQVTSYSFSDIDQN